MHCSTMVFVKPLDRPGQRPGVVARCTLTLLILAFSCAVARTGQATPRCDVAPDRPKLYRLELTVPATFCRDRFSDRSCREFPKPAAIQLHGLWPNYRSGFPEGACSDAECPHQSPELGSYCRYPEPPGLYESGSWKALNGYMAGTENCLERHEWVKHGTCSPMDATTYFTWALQNTRRIASALRWPADRPVSRRQFHQRVAKRLPELAGAIRLTCKQGALSSLYVLYEWGPVPTRPIPTRNGANHYGNCPNSFLIPAQPVH